jgi:pyruvate/2-oxoacid:ferredoxin oxidoreductase alpha subunit
MRTLQIAVPDVEYAQLGIQNEVLDFSELEKLMEKNRLRKMQSACVSIAEKYGISTMTMDEINAEIKEYRAEKQTK